MPTMPYTKKRKIQRKRVGIVCYRCKKAFPIGTLTHVRMNEGPRRSRHYCADCTDEEFPEIAEVRLKEHVRDDRLLSAMEAQDQRHYSVVGTVYYINERMRKVAVDQRAAVRNKEDTLPVLSELIAETIRRIAERDSRLLRGDLPIPHIKEIRWVVMNTKGNTVRKGETVWLDPERDPPVSIQTQLSLCVDEALRYYKQRIKETR